MNTLGLGEIFCNWYNKEHNLNLSAKEIFTTVIAPILFNDDKHLINWIHSKFSYMKDKSDFDSALNSFCDEIESEKGGLMDTLKIFGGCSVPYDTQSTKYKDKPQTTLFCYDEIAYYTIEERYCTWIGSCFLIMVNGLLIAVYDENLIKLLYEGLLLYRYNLNNNNSVKGRQLPTWNLIYLYEQFNNKENTIFENYLIDNALKSTFSFEHFLFTIVKYFPNVKYFNIQNISQTNTSCGTILVDTSYVKRMYDVFQIIYKNIEQNDDFVKFDFNKIFGGKNVIYKAIELGAIYDGFFNPIEHINLNDKPKSKQLIYIINYIELVMNKELLTLANDFITSIKNIKKMGSKKNNKNLNLNISLNRTDFINSIALFKDNTDNSEILDDMVLLIAGDTLSDKDYKLLITYLNYINK